MSNRDGSFNGLIEKGAATLSEACELYGLNRPVDMRPLTYIGADGKPLISPFHQQTVDTETDNPLGVVGAGYQLVPYETAFAFVEPLLENGAKMISGGAPHFGQVAYLVLENPGSIKVGNHEILNRFMLRSSHDGSTKIECRSTPYFTANRIAMTVDATRALCFKHTKRVNDRLHRARNTYKRVNENWNEFSEGVQRMITTSIDEKDAKAFIEQITPSTSDSTRIQNIREDIFTLFKLTGQCRTLVQCKGTLFGLVQAVGEWADFHRVTRKTNKRSQEAALLDARLISDAAKKKQKAWALSLWMVNNGKLRGASVGGE
jgi:phage/plasmid-like protein (TIGR03299 family)